MVYPDARLLENFRRRETGAFTEIYDKYSSALYGITVKIVRSDTVAQDVLQEAFVKIWQCADQYDPEKGTLFTWLLNITRRTAIDKIRSAGYRRITTVDSISETKPGDWFEQNQGLNPDHIGVKALVDRRLEEKYRQVIDLLYFQGMTQKEVQEYLGIPLGTVKSRTRIAMRKLRDLFLTQSITFILLTPTMLLIG